MKFTSGRPVTDALAAIGSIAAVVAGVALLDADARGLLRRAVSGDLQLSALVPGLRIHQLMRTAVDVVGRDHIELAAFVVAGLVLFVMMFKL